MHGSDEEVDEPLEVDSDEDLSDGEKQLQEEVRMCATVICFDKSSVVRIRLFVAKSICSL